MPFLQSLVPRACKQALTLQKQKERQMREGEREKTNIQTQRRVLQYATKSYSPSKVAKEWRNIPLSVAIT